MKDRSILLLHSSDYRKMDWKNGNGKTSEIAIFPKEAKFPNDLFLWRLSSARIEKNGPFSQFKGYNRILSIISGNGIRLRKEQSNQSGTVLQLGKVFQFSGNDLYHCELISGEAEDIHLIYRQDEIQAQVSMIQLRKKPKSIQVEGNTVFLFSVLGDTSVSIYPGEEKITLKNQDTIQVDHYKEGFHQSMMLLEPKAHDSLIVVVELSLKSRTVCD